MPSSPTIAFLALSAATAPDTHTRTRLASDGVEFVRVVSHAPSRGSWLFADPREPSGLPPPRESLHFSRFWGISDFATRARDILFAEEHLARSPNARTEGHGCFPDAPPRLRRRARGGSPRFRPRRVPDADISHRGQASGIARRTFHGSLRSRSRLLRRVRAKGDLRRRRRDV